MIEPDKCLAAYAEQASTLIAQYEALRAERVHASWLDLARALPRPALVLDIGAGSGRDAAWLAHDGHQVVAVEPVAAFRTWGQRAHGPGIRWLDDRLPALKAVLPLELRFDLILLSAVWIHVPQSLRECALQQIGRLLRPAGLSVFTLRQGPAPAGRPLEPVSAEELVEMARPLGLEPVRVVESGDVLARPGVCWQTVCLRKA